jgi:succinyl-diaminopimelate desuccinylase
MTPPGETSVVHDTTPLPQFASIVHLAQQLVRIPSRAGEDAPEPVIEPLRGWLEQHGVPATPLHSPAGALVAVVGEVNGAGPGPSYCLNACLDTAPFGDLTAWSRPPTSGEVADGLLHGRGAADSKLGAAIFAHLAAEFASAPDTFSGRLLVLFDADEHTGTFGGARAFLERYPEIDGVMIGYPGSDAIIIGARGFYRATLTVHAAGGHSGARSRQGPNAVDKAASLVQLLREARLPEQTDPDFPLTPALTVTGIRGGDSFSTIPDRCQVLVDIRLTPRFGAHDARKLLDDLLTSVDRDHQTARPTQIQEFETWPAYRLAEGEPVARALIEAAREHCHPSIAPRVCGPSNIGNLCAAHGIPATCGFGISFTNIHAPDEAASTADVPVVYRTYRSATRKLLSA